MKTLHVIPMVRRNGLTLVLLGMVITIAMIFILFFFPEQLLMPVIFLLLTGLMTILVGALKLAEPHFSLSLCQDCLQYHHKYGGWILKWRNIQRIDQPRIHLGWDLVPLPYIGLKIKDYDDFLTLITPRLAVRLLRLPHRRLRRRLVGRGAAGGEPLSLLLGPAIRGGDRHAGQPHDPAA